MRITFIIITKDRPRMVKRLINSILEAKLHSFSLVLIDDSNFENFHKTRSYLQSQSIPFKQTNSLQAGRHLEKILQKSDLTPNEEDFIRKCTGLSSPFCRYVKRFLGTDELKLDHTRRGFEFAPYSPARNLGIYWAVRSFNPEVISFLDDDCVLLHPQKLEDELSLANKKLNQKSIVAVSGFYKDIAALNEEKPSEHDISEKTVGIIRGMDAFLRKSFVSGEARFKTMPPHLLGGTLVLRKSIFLSLPFDPYVARGEDHAYALDLKSYLSGNRVAIRDSRFLVGHQTGASERHIKRNVLRDIFRFIYIQAKTGRSFIPFFRLRWLLAAFVKLFLHPSEYKQVENELWALLYEAPRFAKDNACRFMENIVAWKGFLNSLEI